MSSLSTLLSSFDVERGLELPDDWRQGRTAYGGILTALAVAAAMTTYSGQMPPLRSVQVTFIGPAVGQLEFRPQVLREGKSVVNVGVDVIAEGALAARLALVFGRSRDSAIAHDFGPLPAVPGPEACREFNMSGMPFAPAFTRNFVMRPAGGAQPISGATHPELLIWMRHVDASGVDPAVALVAMADALPPAAFTSFTAAAPISSINWSFDMLEPVPVGEWFLLRSFSEHARDGYSSQDMQVWNAQGQLLLRGRQSVAVFA
ncbi:thioesterase family protein [Stenotrophomonas sp. SY1]|uniref:thioesterase family protein n=1 Tax=Stenotrophomonas sp. SY1 TaxID=477235 RepID=UPI001E564FCC|nr:thioesterase family protein [Stenotrophomonas sp. SY1]MCD9086855.1 thioesterase family protein [Stenotrophomonas sp. SY1]